MRGVFGTRTASLYCIDRASQHVLCSTCNAPQDKYHLYFLFDLMSGGDLMDVLVSEAQVGGWLAIALVPEQARPL